MLQNGHPDKMAIIKEKLLEFVFKTEKKANAKHGSYWYRPFRPNDKGIGGTAKTYYATYTASTEEELLALGSTITVPTAYAYAIFGHYLDGDLGDAGYIRIKKNNVLKVEIPARKIYQAKDPKHMYLDFDHVFFMQENETFNYIVYNVNASGNDMICMALPIMFIIASKAALNLL